MDLLSDSMNNLLFWITHGHTHVLVKSSKRESNLDKITRYIHHHGACTPEEVHKAIGIPYLECHRRMSDLKYTPGQSDAKQKMQEKYGRLFDTGQTRITEYGKRPSMVVDFLILPRRLRG